MLHRLLWWYVAKLRACNNPIPCTWVILHTCVRCIFGCPGCDDSLEHYMSCDPLWTAVISTSYKRTELLQTDLFFRFGFSCSHEALKMLTIAFSCYHALKLGHRDEILSSFAFGHPCQVHDRRMNYAKAYACEICTWHTFWLVVVWIRYHVKSYVKQIWCF